MAQRYKDEAGNIWEMGPTGQPSLVSAAQSPMLANPKIGYETQSAAGAAAAAPFAAPKAAVDLNRAQTEAHISAATAPAEIAQKQANARQTAAQASTAEANLQTTGGANEGQAKSASFYTRALRSNHIYDNTGIKNQPAGHSLALTLLPDAVVNQFTSSERQQAEAAQRDFISATLRYESGAAIPPSEFEAQRKIFFPASGDDPETIKVKAQLRQNAIDGLKLASGPAGTMLDQPDQAAATTSLTDIVRPKFTNTFDAQTSAAVDHLIRMGRPVQEIGAFAQSKGYPVTPEILSSIAQAQLYLKQNPKYKGGFTEANRPMAMTAWQKIAGSPLGATAAAAGDAASFGLSDEAAGAIGALGGGDYTEGRDAFNAGKHLLADAHPYANFAGTALGAASAMGAIGKGVQALKLPGILAPAARYGQTAADAAKIGATRAATLGDIGYGGGYGAGENNENRLLGAGEGGLAGYGGNLVGRAAGATAAGMFSPSGGKLSGLYEMGVRPSIGQRFGGVVDSAEERLQSIPVIGDAIAGTRQRARDQFQIGLFNDSLGEIGTQLPKGMKPGHDPHRFAQDAFAKAYDTAERGMTAVVDPSFGADLGNLQKTVATLPHGSQNTFSTIWENSIGRRFKSGGGSLSGDAYKDAMSEISKKVASIRKNPSGDHELAAALDEAMTALRGSATRNSPPQAVAALDAADRGYAKLVRLETASRKAGGDAATFSPSQYNSAVKEASGGIRNRGYLAGDALNSDIAAQGLHLGDVVANSRTVDRLLPVMAATGGAYVSPPAGAALGAYGLLNAPGIRNLTTGMFAPRGGKARAVADLIRRHPEFAAALGSGVGIGLLPSQ